MYVVNGTNEDNPEMRTPLFVIILTIAHVCVCVREREREFTALV